MGIFSRKKKDSLSDIYETEADRAERLRQQAIEYIVSLSKGDKERFMDAVDLIWQGYNALNRVKTIDERQEANYLKKARIASGDDENFGLDFIEQGQEGKK